MKYSKNYGLLALVAVVALVLVSYSALKEEERRSESLIHRRPESLPPREWGIVFGAKVWGDRPSPMLEDRIKTAHNLYLTGKIKKIMLSGGPSEEGAHEAVFMSDMLQRFGVPQEALAIDLDGLSTLDTLENARKRLHISSPILITQEFHLPRALYLAQSLGLDALGLVADQRIYQDQSYLRLREGLARFKAVLEVYRRKIMSPSILWNFLLSDRDSSVAAGRQRIQEIFATKGLPYPPQEVTLLAFKDRRILELYAPRGQGATPAELLLVKSYPVLAASGLIGPKLREGDLQVPEGIYRVTYRNLKSRFHLSLRLDYPNAFDVEKAKLDQRTSLGGDIMIHGESVSIGCLAIGNSPIEELFALATDSELARWKVIIAPTDLRGHSWPSFDGPRIPSWYPELLEMIKKELNKVP